MATVRHAGVPNEHSRLPEGLFSRLAYLDDIGIGYCRVDLIGTGPVGIRPRVATGNSAMLWGKWRCGLDNGGINRSAHPWFPTKERIHRAIGARYCEPSSGAG